MSCQCFLVVCLFLFFALTSKKGGGVSAQWRDHGGPMIFSPIKRWLATPGWQRMAPSRGAQVRRDVSTEKKWAKLVVIRAFLGDHMLPMYVGIMINHYNNPYQTTRIRWKVGVFFRGAAGWWCFSYPPMVCKRFPKHTGPSPQKGSEVGREMGPGKFQEKSGLVKSYSLSRCMVYFTYIYQTNKPFMWINIRYTWMICGEKSLR